jgi:hypothetical protein
MEYLGSVMASRRYSWGRPERLPQGARKGVAWGGGVRPISVNLLLFPRALRLLHAAFCCRYGCAPARCSSQVRTADS